MSKISKILVTIVVVFVGLIVFSVISAIQSEAGSHTPGILGLIIFAAMFGALKAIWKKPKKDDDGKGNSILQK